MNDLKLNEYLNAYGKSHSPEPSRALIDNIMAIPREIDQSPGFSWNISDWFLFLVPRLSGLTAVCILGIYMGGAGSSALAEDEIAVINSQTFEIVGAGGVSEGDAEPLLDVEEFIFAEEQVQ